MRRFVLLIYVIIIICFIQLKPITAQENINIVYIVAETVDGIVLFEQNLVDSTLQLMSAPFSNFAIEKADNNEAEWLILSHESFAIAPDNQHVAFTARRNASDEAAIFIYNITDNTLTQHSISSNWFVLTWSPDGEAILLRSGSPYWSAPPVPHDYVYELTTDTVFQITFTEGWERSFTWTADSQALLYLGTCTPDDCGNPTRDIYYVTRDGSRRFPLTDFPNELTPNTYIDTCYLSWSPQTQRWYYVIGCGGEFDNYYTYIYSTDIEGDNRLELDVINYIETTEAGNPTVRYGLVKGIHARPDGIYATVEFSFYPDADVYPDMANVSTTHSRVLRLTDEGGWEMVYSQPVDIMNGNPSGLRESVISPDGQHMVLLLYRDILVVDIVNNRTVASFSTLVPRIDEGYRMVCDIRWLHNETIIYNFGEQICDGLRLGLPDNVFMFNIASNTSTNLTEEIDGNAWVIPVPAHQ